MPAWVTPTVLKYVGIVGATLILVLGAFMKGRHDVQVKFDAYKAEVHAAAEAQAKESAKVDEKNQKLFKDAQNAYNTSLANLRAYYSLRNGKGGGSLPQISGTSAGADDQTANDIPALPPVATLAAQCAETTLTLTSLQDWIKNVSNNMEQ